MFGKSREGKPSEEPEYTYYTIFDTKVGAYREPVLARSDAEVIRDIENMYRNPQQQQNQLVTNSEDFQLFKVASWDKKRGTILGYQPVHIVNLHDLRSKALRDQRPEATRLAVASDEALQAMKPVGIAPT